ncbi:hypothetical protein D3C78_1145410 [compost metagenome]
MPGVVAMQGPKFNNYADAEKELRELSNVIQEKGPIPSCPMIILCDDSSFMSASISNFLWATFTRSNPSHDIYGVNSSYEHKHWGCDNMIIDARTKPHQAPPLMPDPTVEKNIERLFAKGASLSGIL